MIARIVSPFAILAVSFALVAGFHATGSPQHRQEIALDDARVDDLRDIAVHIADAYGTTSALPARLSTAAITRTGTSYAYEKLDLRHYRLCAHFTIASTESASSFGETWAHPAGYACYTFDAAVATPTRAASGRAMRLE